MINKSRIKRSKHFEKVKDSKTKKPHFYLHIGIGIAAACGDPSDNDWKIVGSMDHSWAFKLIERTQRTADLSHD